MAEIQKYIMAVIYASIIVMLISAFVDKKSAMYSVMKMMTGIFLVMTLISPFYDSSIFDFSEIFQYGNLNADSYILQGTTYANQEKESLIKEGIVTYISDRASEMNVDLEIDVALNQDLSGPEVIYIAGDISPYLKERLQNIISKDLGITEEYQIWS